VQTNARRSTHINTVRPECLIREGKRSYISNLGLGDI
jgi:hypothetical protein